MTEVEFNYLKAKIVGNDCVVFRLEDGAQVIVRVDITRAGSRVNEKTGQTDYNFEFHNQVKIVPAKRTFKVSLPEQGKGDKGYIK